MKPLLFFIIALAFVPLSCKKSQPVPEKMEIDFSQNKVFTVSELSNSKTNAIIKNSNGFILIFLFIKNNLERRKASV